MDNEKEKTKDYREEFEKIDEEVTEEETVEEVKDEKNKEDIKDEFFEEKPKKDNKTILLLILAAILIIVCVTCIVYLVINNKNNNEENTNTDKIVRPSDDLDYTILKQNYFAMSCKNTIAGDKYKKLAKGLTIDCAFGYEVQSNQKVTELYFDLNNSANVKLKKTKNDSDFKINNDGKLYRLIPTQPQSVLDYQIHFYFEVLNDTDEVGYVELSNIVFKDENGKYYKVLNSIETFPPEYDDKLYIYKGTYEDGEDDQVYYYSSKVKYTEDELFDTFQCTSESCETLAEANNYFLIKDNNLLVYDTIKKTTNTLKLPDTIKLEDYIYEVMLNTKGKILGISFKKNYTSAYDCTTNQYVCINTGLSGYEIGYYSMALNTFTIDLDYGFIGANVNTDYDIAMLLKKDNEFGIFSYEDDNMMLELSDKYKAIDYDEETESVVLEVYDEKNKDYYFELFDPKYATFTIDTDKLNKYENSSIYYTVKYNRLGQRVTMLFDSKGNQLAKLPYVKSDNLVSVTNTIVVKNELYSVYDLKGNLLYVTQYEPKNVLSYTKSYIIAKKDNKFVLDGNEGNTLVNIRDITDTTTFVSAEENDTGVLIVIIKDTSITEEGKNAYKYTIEMNKPFSMETIHVD